MACEGAASTLDALPLRTDLDSEARAGIGSAVAIASTKAVPARVTSDMSRAERAGAV
jgi:DNA primase